MSSISVLPSWLGVHHSAPERHVIRSLCGKQDCRLLRGPLDARLRASCRHIGLSPGTIGRKPHPARCAKSDASRRSRQLRSVAQTPPRAPWDRFFAVAPLSKNLPEHTGEKRLQSHLEAKRLSWPYSSRRRSSTSGKIARGMLQVLGSNPTSCRLQSSPLALVCRHVMVCAL
jgi:hypothetical protein